MIDHTNVSAKLKLRPDRVLNLFLYTNCPFWIVKAANIKYGQKFIMV